MKNYELRDYIYLGIFGTLWGVVEAVVGMLLHTFNVPFTGAIMVAFGLICAILGKYFVPKRFSIIYIGIIVIFIKTITSGFHVPVAVGIFIEAIIMEICISTIGLNMTGNIVAGCLCEVFTMVQRIVFLTLFVGKNIIIAYAEFAKELLKLFDIQEASYLEIFLLSILPRLIIGIFAGYITTSIIKIIKKRNIQATSSIN